MSSTRQKTIEKIIKSLDNDTVLDRNIVSEVEQSFLDYAMSVITARALPDLKDGLKPVHRRIIYAAYQEKLFHDAKFKKSAALVGTVMGSYHPHGDSSIYDALVRMAQDFSLRYPLIEGQGNFGSIDGDSPAAMRYTEARLSKLGKYFLDGIDEECVDFMDNYDQSRKEPVVLPTLIPNILINGSTGIAVGLATNIPPHNLNEVFDAILALLKNPDLTLDEVLQYIKGPDFPTGGEILKYSGVRDYFKSGSGSFKLRSKIDVEEQQKSNLFIIKEIPYGVKKTKIIERIVSLIKPAKNGKVLVSSLADNIIDIRDESNLEGIRLVIECKNDIPKQVIINNLYRHTQLQTSYSPNLTVLINNEPKKISILELLRLYLEHQLEMFKKRTIFQLGVLVRRLHILEGRIKIASDIMEAIKIVNTFENPEEEIQRKYELSKEQVDDIFKLTIGSLKKISVDKLREEHVNKNESKLYKEGLLSSEEKMKEVFAQNIIELRNKFGDERRTRINELDSGKIDYYELFHFRKTIISLTQKGYLSQIPLETFRVHKRGGMGSKGTFVHKDDAPKMLLVCFGSDDVLFFSDSGKVYRKKAFELDLSTNKNRSAIAYNVLQGMDRHEKIITIISLERNNYLENKYLLFATKGGMVKKTKLSMFAKINATGKKAIKLKEGDALKFVIKIEEDSQICLASSSGNLVRFESTDLRPRSRNTIGVYGLKLESKEELVSASSTAEGEYVFSISEKARGKLTHIEEFRIVKVGRKKGTQAQKINEKTGRILACTVVNRDDEMLLMTSSNKVNRFKASDVSVQSRVTSGVKLFNLEPKEKLVYFAKNPEGEEEEVSENL